MKGKLLPAILLISIVFISGCVVQETEASPSLGRKVRDEVFEIEYPDSIRTRPLNIDCSDVGYPSSPEFRFYGASFEPGAQALNELFGQFSCNKGGISVGDNINYIYCIFTSTDCEGFIENDIFEGYEKIKAKLGYEIIEQINDTHVRTTLKGCAMEYGIYDTLDECRYWLQ